MRYWGYRIDTSEIPFFSGELEQGRLRQGWGGPGQDLQSHDNSTHRNQRMRKDVKKGDVLLVPRLPTWDRVAIVEAAEDWIDGYRFEVPPQEDYGHIFPARLIKSFSREAPAVSGDLRAGLRCRRRFWNMDWYGQDVKALLGESEEALTTPISDEERQGNAVEEAFRQAFSAEKFGKEVYERLNREFDNTRWEDVLVRVLKTRYPAPCEVERVGGRTESEHGTDILISLPGVGEGPLHTIAVQVKDYEGKVGNEPVDQIARAERWDKQDAHSVIEKVVILTKAKREDNADLVTYASDKEVRLVFAEDLKELLTEYGKRTMLTSSA